MDAALGDFVESEMNGLWVGLKKQNREAVAA